MESANIIIAGVVTGIFTIAAHVFVRQWYKPDIRYETGEYYRSGDSAVTSLKLVNYGHAPAEEVQVTVNFPAPIKNIISSDPTLPFELISDQRQKTTASGQLKRLVPKQKVFLYFEIPNTEGSLSNEYYNFVTTITHKLGQGKTGFPFWVAIKDWVFVILVAVLFSVASTSLWIYFNINYASLDRSLESLKAQMNEIVNTDSLLTASRVGFGVRLDKQDIRITKLDSVSELHAKAAMVLINFIEQAKQGGLESPDSVKQAIKVFKPKNPK